MKEFSFEEETYLLLHELSRINQGIKTCSDNISKSVNNTESTVSKNMKTLSDDLSEMSYHFGVMLNYAACIFNPEENKMEKAVFSIHGKFYNARRAMQRSITAKKLTVNIGKYEKIHLFYPIICSLPYILLENAIKYAPQSSTIEITFEEVNNKLEIIITNEGPTLCDYEKILDLGTRGNNAEISEIGGSGRGMYFLQRILDINSAKIEIKSQGDGYLFNGVEYSTFICNVLIPF